MMNVFRAEKILQRRDKLKAALEKERGTSSQPQSKDTTEQVKSYNKRIIKFMHHQFMNEQVVVQDDNFQASQEQKLEQAIRCTVPQRRANSVVGTRTKKLMNQMPSNCRNSSQSNFRATINKFQNDDLEMNPRDRHMFQFESTMERVRKSIDDHKILDTSPGLNHDNTFSSILRQGQKDRSKDLGPCAFRYRETAAERLLQVEMDPINMNPPKGIHKLQKTRNKLFMPETVKWIMPENVVGESNVVEIQERNPWAQNLPFVKDGKQIHSHLHQKTHFKSTHSFYLQSDTKNINIEDREVCNMIKEIQKTVNKKRRAHLKAAMLKMLKRKMSEDGGKESQLLKSQIQQRMDHHLRTANQDKDKPQGFVKKSQKQPLSDSDEDPGINLVDFKKITKELLQNSHVLRRPSVQSKGPNQAESKFIVFNRIISNNK